MANLFYIPFKHPTINSDLFRVTLSNDTEYQLYTKILYNILGISFINHNNKLPSKSTTDLCMVYKSKAAYSRSENPVYERPELVLLDGNNNLDFVGFLKEIISKFSIKESELTFEVFELTKSIYQYILEWYGNKEKMMEDDYKSLLINQFCFLNNDFLNSHLNPLENPFFITGESIIFDLNNNSKGNIYKILGLINEKDDHYVYYHTGVTEYSNFGTTQEVECLSKFIYVNTKDLVELIQYRRGIWIKLDDLLNYKFLK